MKPISFSPDDPKLTAYALGELSGDERAAVEAALRDEPALRAIVDEVRATAAQLEAVFAAETIDAPAAAEPKLRVNGHAVHVAAEPPPARADAATATGTAAAERRPRRRAKFIRFPQFYYVVGGLAAACFACMVAVYREAHDAKEQAKLALQRQRETEQRAVRRDIIGVSLPVTVEAPARVAEAARPEPMSEPVPRTAGAPAPAAVSTEPAEVASARPAFLDGALSLSEQVRRETPAVPPAKGGAVAAAAPLAPVGAGAAADKPLPAVGEKENSAGAGSTAAAPTASANAAPLASAPAVGEPPRPPAPAAAPDPIATPRARPASDAVMLDTFAVSAEREGRALAVTPAAAAPTAEPARRPSEAALAHNTEAYAYTQENDFVGVENQPLSTFSVDVDTASYANVRRIIEYGTLPPRDAVRVEELLNYFPYRYPPPQKADGVPFAASLEVAEAPWAPEHRLVLIGLKAREVATAERGPANLVFLLDVSGSMDMPNKLPLVKESLRLLLGRLRADDRVAIVTYAGHSGLALPSTPVARSAEILRALDALTPGGSTNGAMGIQLAYDIAKANFRREGVNRVILCTDGDFNVGVTSEGELVRLVEEKARSGVFLTVLGFGMGNLKDATLEKLADKGNGHYGYIDTRREAEKLLVEQVSSTLVTVAKDVKIQVEFNPAKVARYRLIGYENRVLKKEDFNNDNVDAGEIGAGHSVTALYEIVPVGADAKFTASRGRPPPVDDLKYQVRGAVSSRLEMPSAPAKRAAAADELLTVKVRYKKPEALFSQKTEFALKDGGLQFAKASADFRFAAAVAQFGMILRGSPHKGSATIGDVIAWAAKAAASPADDPGGYRGEFIDLARKAQRMVE